MSLTSRVFRGSALNLTDQSAKLLVMFFITPLVVSSLGVEQYGNWLLLMVAVSYYEYLDFGVTLSGIRFLARAIGSGDEQVYRNTVGTLLRIFRRIGWICAGLTLVVSAGFYYFRGPALSRDQISLLLLVFGFSITVRYFLRIYLIILKSHVRYDWVVTASLTKLCVQTTLIVILLLKGYGIIALVIAHLLADLIDQVLIVLFARHADRRGLAGKHYDRELSREIIRYSGMLFLGTTSMELRNRVDPFIIAGCCGVSVVPIYSIGVRLIYQLVDMTNAALGGTLLSAFSQMVVSQSREEVQRRFLQIFRFSVPFVVFALSLAFLYGPSFIVRWLGPEFYDSGLVLRLLAVPFALQLIQHQVGPLFMAIGKQQHLIWARFGGALFNLVLSIVLGIFFGLLGVVWATVIEMLLLFGAVYPLMTHRIAGFSLSEGWRRYLPRTLFIILVPMFVFYQLTASFTTPSYLRIACLCLGQAAIVIPLSLFFLLERSERNQLWQVFRSQWPTRFFGRSD